MTRYPRQLSGGQRQRVAMGRAIVRDPQVFLFDEPLSNLDAKLRVAMRTEIKALHQRLRTTSIYVTHDQVEAMTMADRIVLMRDGRLGGGRHQGRLCGGHHGHHHRPGERHRLRVRSHRQQRRRRRLGGLCHFRAWHGSRCCHRSGRVSGDGQVTVSWSAPQSDGGSPITGYTVTSSSGGSWATLNTSLTVTGLANGQEYSFTVAANNAAGAGPMSQASPRVTPQAPAPQPRPQATTPQPPAPQPTAPQPPASVKVKATSKQSKLFVDVNPNKAKGYWSFRVQRLRTDGSWKFVKAYRTKGSKETRTINLPQGTYRVVVTPKYGYAEGTSAAVYLGANPKTWDNHACLGPRAPCNSAPPMRGSDCPWGALVTFAAHDPHDQPRSPMVLAS